MITNRLNYSFATNFKTGYSIASTNIGLELSNLGYDLCIFPIGGISNNPEIKSWVTNNHFRKRECDYKAKGLKLFHQTDMLELPICSERIGFPIFELNKFTDQEVNSLMSLDRLVVCSKWAKDICATNLNIAEEKIGVCPLGVDTKIFSPRIKPQTDKYIFVNVGKMTHNKGHDILPTIFNRTFTQNDNVELWMFAHNPFLTQQEQNNWHKLYLDTPLGHKIKFFPPFETQLELAHLLKNADAAIFPARAEGFNLELLEMFAMNIPCVATNYSGHTEFCSSDNCFLVEINELEEAVDNRWFFGQGDWAKIGEAQINLFVDNLRYLYKNRINENPAGVIAGKKYSWQNSAKTLAKFIWN